VHGNNADDCIDILKIQWRSYDFAWPPG